MNLYQIDQAILDLVDPETGEIMDWEVFDALQMERETKVENVACWYKNLVAEAAAIRREELNLQKRRQDLEKQAETKKKWLENALCGQKFKTARCSITWTKTTSCAVEDETAAIAWLEKNGHADAVKYTAPTVNKAETTKLLKEQVPVPGCALAYGTSMGVK